MSQAQEIIFMAAIGILGVMFVIPPWNATKPKGNYINIPVIEKGPSIYRSIFLDPPHIYRDGFEYIPEVDKKRLAAQFIAVVLIAVCMMFVFKNKKEQDDWPPRNRKNIPWNAGK
jgi:hypothetical protein